VSTNTEFLLVVILSSYLNLVKRFNILVSNPRLHFLRVNDPNLFIVYVNFIFDNIIICVLIYPKQNRLTLLLGDINLLVVLFSIIYHSVCFKLRKVIIVSCLVLTFPHFDIFFFSTSFILSLCNKFVIP
jgi:hypothetical protein